MTDADRPSWSRPPFTEGNSLAHVHGATSPRTAGPLAEQLEQEERASPSWPAFLDTGGYDRLLRKLFQGEAAEELLWRFWTQQDLEAALAEVTAEESEQTSARGRTKRSAVSRRTMSAFTAWQKQAAANVRLRAELGLTPKSRAQLSKDLATTAVQASIAKLQQDGAELVAAARASGALSASTSDGVEALSDDLSGQEEAT